MAGLGGVEAGFLIRAARPDLPVVLMMAFADYPPTDLGVFADWLAGHHPAAVAAA